MLQPLILFPCTSPCWHVFMCVHEWLRPCMGVNVNYYTGTWMFVGSFYSHSLNLIHFFLIFPTVELAMIMDRLYGGVCYAGIDTDPELKYPKGAGRVAFSNQQSYIAAISARFVQLQHGDIDKRVCMEVIFGCNLCYICWLWVYRRLWNIYYERLQLNIDVLIYAYVYIFRDKIHCMI